MFLIMLPGNGYKAEKLRVAKLSLSEARSIVEKLTGEFCEGIYANLFDDNEDYVNILGGHEGKYVCTYNTLMEGSLFVYRPGCSTMSPKDERVSINESDYYPPEVIVDAETAAQLLYEFIRQGNIPDGFNWHE